MSSVCAQGHVVHGVAPGEAPAAATTDPDGNPVGGDKAEDIEKKHQQTLLHAELDLYEEFALRHCDGRRDPPAVCSEVRETVLNLKHELSATTAASVRGWGWEACGTELWEFAV